MTTSIPFPAASNRTEARANALYFLTVADETVSQTGNAPDRRIQMARVWTLLSNTFPEDSILVVDNLAGMQEQVMRSVIEEDHHPHPGASQDATETIPRVNADDGTVVISQRIWDGLRAIAIWYLWNGDNSTVTLSSAQVQRVLQDFSLELRLTDDTVQAWIRSINGA